jgi:uncharacterized membrane protein YfcA
MSADFWFWALAIIASLFVGISKGGLPLIGILAVPIMSLVISPVVAAGLLLPIYVVSDMYGLWIYRHEYDKRNIAILVPAATIGIGIGWATAHITSEEVVKFMVGVIGMAYCLDAIVKSRRSPPAKPADIPRGIFWGTISGFTSFVSHAGGPPYQMYVLPQRLEKMVYAGTTTIIFAIVNALKLPPYWMLGQINMASLEKCLILGPVSLVGAYVGYKATKIMQPKLFFRAVEVALFLVAILLIKESAPGVWSLIYHLFV